jgi:hypothetical protein
VRIENRRKVMNSPETAEGMFCDGIACVPKDATLADGWVM